jgi:hypothetical protein
MRRPNAAAASPDRAPIATAEPSIANVAGPATPMHAERGGGGCDERSDAYHRGEALLSLRA